MTSSYPHTASPDEPLLSNVLIDSRMLSDQVAAVSYTHLTLPTIYSV